MEEDKIKSLIEDSSPPGDKPSTEVSEVLDLYGFSRENKGRSK